MRMPSTECKKDEQNKDLMLRDSDTENTNPLCAGKKSRQLSLRGKRKCINNNLDQEQSSNTNRTLEINNGKNVAIKIPSENINDTPAFQVHKEEFERISPKDSIKITPCGTPRKFFKTRGTNSSFNSAFWKGYNSTTTSSEETIVSEISIAANTAVIRKRKIYDPLPETSKLSKNSDVHKPSQKKDKGNSRLVFLQQNNKPNATASNDIIEKPSKDTQKHQQSIGTKFSNLFKLSLNTTNLAGTRDQQQITSKTQSNTLKRSASDQNLNNSFNKRTKTEAMSLYDHRLQSDERSVGNGFVSRGSHNDEGSNSLTNHYYSCNQQPSIATLCNIGNTCYLNSVVYTLRFAPLFLHKLHHLVEDLLHIHQKIGKNRAKSSSLGRNISGLHMENTRSWSSKDLVALENSSYDVPKSNQQIATEKLHELYQNLHKNELIETTEPFHADTFLHAIQEVSAIFEGNQQQDAHEFLMCVLDSIRETCQSLIKSISECPDVITNGYISLPEQTEVQPLVMKERESSIIKTSFFSRKSKRKDETKNAKGLRINSPHKDNTINVSSDVTDGATNSKNSLSSISTTDDDISINDKERISDKIKKLGLDFFTEDFEGITVSTTKCLSCETITEQKETMIDIAVPISGYENLEASEKSQSFIQNSCITREYFRGENKYHCEQCIGYTEAIRSISYEVLPRLLVIQLSRFSGGMEKINSYLPTPFTLQCFCAKCCEQPENKKLHVYKLYSVITHVGATMSVGHYIAYTCSLDWASDYVNCPKDRKRQAQLNSINTSLGTNNGSNNTTSTTSTEKNLGLMKKMRFGRSKASSSGDMSKNMKNMNGISNKTITNGVEKLNINTTCHSLNCCGIRIKNNSCSNTSYNNGSCSSNNNNGLFIDINDDNQSSSLCNTNTYGDTASTTTNYGGAGKNKTTNSQPIWYMCDDDKIKAMSQREFEDLLSPNRKIMITPYLLFYARSDLQ